MTPYVSFCGVTAMRVKSESIKSDGKLFFVTRVYFIDAKGVECCITAMHADKPVTLDGAEFMNFTIAAAKQKQEEPA